MKPKIIRTSTVPVSLDVLLKGQLAFLNKHFNIIAVSGEDEHLAIVRKREDVKTIAVQMERNISPLKDLKSLFQLYKVFKKERPQIVHSITPKAGLLSMLAAKFSGVPIRIHTFTGLIFPSKTGWMQKLLIIMDRLLCWAATTIIPEGNGVKQDLIAYKITDKPLKIIANGNVNGIDLAHFNPELFDANQSANLRAQLDIKATDFVFIFVGRLVSDKGINELIKAFESLIQENKTINLKLLLVGPFEIDFDPLNEETLSTINKNPNIISVGYQQDVRPYFALSNALVFPSYREGFPNVVMQAGAMGLPSIVSNINGCNEIIIEAENGLIVPVKDFETLKFAMSRLFTEPALLKHLTANARPMVLDRYEQSIVWQAVLKEYENLLKP